MKKISKNSKKTLIILGAIFITILILNIVINVLEKKQVESDNNKATTGYTSIEQILEKYECELIKETKSSDKNYTKDLYVRFKYNTFEGTESKKLYYEKIISASAGFINANYRLIDKDRELLIEVQRKTNSEGNTYYTYAVNGEQEYFKKYESKIALENYKEDQTINLEINSSIINSLIQNKWKTNVDFGTKDSSFEKYDIYFDEGLEVRNISGKVYNIVFTLKYEQEVVNGIKVGTSFAEIVKKIGEPTFRSEDEKIIGYKNNDIYVFFSKDEISIYRNEKNDTKKFEELLSRYIDKTIDIKEFMNELTYLWPDYEEYNYTSSYLYINYPNKGIEIEMKSDNPIGIKIYKNYNTLDNLQKYIKDGVIDSDLETDLFYKIEYNNILRKEQQAYEHAMFEQYKMFQTYSKLYCCNVKNNKINLLSQDSNIPNRTLNINPNSIFWYSDTVLVYSINNKGIYFYDLNTEENKIIIEGNETFKIEKYENQKIIYDNGKEINI